VLSPRGIPAARRCAWALGGNHLNNSPLSRPDAGVGSGDAHQLSRRPPPQVVMAIQLAALNYGLGLVSIIVFWGYFSTLQSPGSLIWNQLVLLAVFTWLYYKIYAGRNWARITLLLFFALSAILTTNRVIADRFMELISPAPTLLKVHMMIWPAIGLVVLWLLFVSPGRHWFGRKSDATAA
jgi:hypothetical protein